MSSHYYYFTRFQAKIQELSHSLPRVNGWIFGGTPCCSDFPGCSPNCPRKEMIATNYDYLPILSFPS